MVQSCWHTRGWRYLIRIKGIGLQLEDHFWVFGIWMMDREKFLR